MEDTKLVGILHAEYSIESYKRGEMTRKEIEEKAIYKELDAKMRKATFREVLEEMVKGEKGAGREIAEYLQQHNGHNLICEVRVYDAEANRKTSETGSEVFKLEEKIASYAETRALQSGQAYDCIEMSADLYSDVGGKDGSSHNE